MLLKYYLKNTYIHCNRTSGDTAIANTRSNIKVKRATTHAASSSSATEHRARRNERNPVKNLRYLYLYKSA